MKYADWSLIDYETAWKRQEEIFNRVIQVKIDGQDTSEIETIVFCEHPHVYTLGKSGNAGNLLVNEESLRSKQASFVKIDRGGDITYHGPGQIVGYPILNLENHQLSLKGYIYQMEEAIIATLDHYDIKATRLEGATGVWLDINSPTVRKICAIGVRASRFVTMHGFALNVNTNLDYFSFINPCGFTTKGVTSMQKELGRTIDMEEVKEVMKGCLKGSLFRY
ncbi:MAG: lipoyl(octanoyl) transferase LipB [Bacteroidales bacterium]|jgi:lipoyl(octanoyl) transferase|nr:lipoyl(octanoyl) transferase LipB [Bacteroidales bacterium]